MLGPWTMAIDESMPVRRVPLVCSAWREQGLLVRVRPIFLRRNRGDLRAGTSLVEVLVAVLVLSILAIGAATFIYYSKTSLLQQSFKRAAILSADQRLEELLRKQSYSTVAACVASGSMVEANIKLNGRSNFGKNSFFRTTTVSNDVEGCLDLTVRVQYAGPDTAVTLKTKRSK